MSAGGGRHYGAALLLLAVAAACASGWGEEAGRRAAGPGAPDGAPAARSASAIGRLVAAGNPIRGVKGGVLLDRQFDADCRLPPDPVQPFSGSLGRSVALEVDFIGCDRPPASATCASSLDPVVEPPVGWGPRVRSLALAMPSQVGHYIWTLDCKFTDGSVDSVSTDLYVTYAPPLASVPRPRRDWYARATQWAKGITLADGEDAAIERVQEGVYALGQHQWLYGYCVLRNDGSCDFPGSTAAKFAGELECSSDAPYVCKCPWHRLVADPVRCNFAACYEFSDAVQYLAATIGIGGFESFTYRGQFGQGFVTPPAARSLDPAFGGNLRCGERQLPCRYAFKNHSLLRRSDGLIVDATFGRIYSAESTVAGDHIECWNAESFLLSFTRMGAYEKDGYGAFSFYAEAVDSNHLPCDFVPRARRSGAGGPDSGDPGSSQVGASQVNDGFSFDPEVKWSAFALEPGPLDVTLEVSVTQPASYVVEGALYHDGELVTDRPIADFVDVRSTARLDAAAASTYTLHLQFASADVFDYGSPGPFSLGAIARRDGEQVASLAAELPPLDAVPHGRPAWLGAPEVLPVVDSAEGTTSLDVTLPVEVAVSGHYAVVGRLAVNGQTLAYAGQQLEREPGPAAVNLLFRGASIAVAVRRGDYTIDFELSELVDTEDGPVPGPLDFVRHDPQRSTDDCR